MSKPSAPPAPDYTAAANATAAGNLEMAKYTTQANRVNQYTPYGSITYSNTPKTVSSFDQAAYDAAAKQAYDKAYAITQTMTRGKDDRPVYTQLTPEQRLAAAQAAQAAVSRDPYTKTTTQDVWSMNQTLSPEQQKLFNQNQAINEKLGNVAERGVGYVSSALDKPLSFDGMYNVGTPEQLQQQASDAAYAASTRYLDPQFQQQQSNMENQLANQGITRGSEAWNREMQNAAMQKEQAYGQARNQAYQQGMAGAQQLYGQGMGLRQQQIAEAQTLRQDPINMLNAVRTGQQMNVANMPQQQNVAQMGQVAGPDLLGAAQATGQYNQGMYNAQSAANSAMWGGLMGMGGAYLMRPTGK